MDTIKPTATPTANSRLFGRISVAIYEIIAIGRNAKSKADRYAFRAPLSSGFVSLIRILCPIIFAGKMKLARKMKIYATKTLMIIDIGIAITNTRPIIEDPDSLASKLNGKRMPPIIMAVAKTEYSAHATK